jgi:hypothetical protein
MRVKYLFPYNKVEKGMKLGIEWHNVHTKFNENQAVVS